MRTLDFKREFAERLRQARQERNLTQRQLAQKIGMKANNISMYENAHRMPSLKMISCMSVALDMSLDDLIPHVTCEVQDDLDQTSIFDFLEEDHEEEDEGQA